MLPRSFYDRHTLEVATDLLGKVLVVVDPRTKRKFAGRIVETEAYFGRDPAAHSANGSLTKSGKLRKKGGQMFGETGKAYVYPAHQGRPMLNIIARSDQFDAGAVLIRAVEPVLENGESPPTNGPAKLCQAFGIRLTDDGQSMRGPRMWIEKGKLEGAIYASPRIGVTSAHERVWRFFVRENLFVTPNKRMNEQGKPWKKHTSFKDI